MALLGQNVERPPVAPADREAGSAVAVYADAADILQQPLGSPNIRPKRFRGLRIGADMAIAVAGELVAAGDDPANQAGAALRHPAQDEERRPHAVVRKDL